jgi:hypothetical protein
VRATAPDNSRAPSVTVMPPSAARRRSNPMPGRPLGKVENSLCSGSLPLAHGTNARHCKVCRCVYRTQPSNAASPPTPFGVPTRTKP